MLTIYRASAGAGKTYKLTGEYLLLLYSQPGAFRRILAVTFTNKATEEMKSRIVEELYHLASGRKSGYISMLTTACSLTEGEVREQARKILISILHDYSAFNVSTIDHFFQQTMRAFTREIGLQGGYGIEMDEKLVLAEAVDRLLADLERPESKELLGWLLRFAEDKIEEGNSWSLRNDILSLGNELFKESYKLFQEEMGSDLADKGALARYKQMLLSLIRSVETEAKSLGSEALALMEKQSLVPTDFKGGSRSAFLFFERLAHGEMKEPSKSFYKLLDNPDEYVTKKTPADIQGRIEAIYKPMNDCVKRVVALFENLTSYRSAREIARFYYTLGILVDISRSIAAYREEKNVLLIADTTELLNRVIQGSDAPFIYEKTGTQVDHYMIDEFQDTSAMQWNNFQPLLEESLGHGRSNLIVGDVKQSIYRFRNSDWKLLDEQVRKDFDPSQVREETLVENWRSCRNIVDFNNAFFTAAPAILQSLYNESLESSSLSVAEKNAFCLKIMQAYDGCYQQVPPPFQHKSGHVRMEFLEEDEERDWKEEALERLPQQIEELQDRGYALKEIAILVRTNFEGSRVVDKLLSYKEEHPSEKYAYDVISDEALYVGSAPTVRFLIALLRYLRNPEDRTSRMLALYGYQLLTGGLSACEEEESAFLSELLPLARQSLYETVEGLFRHFSAHFPEAEQVFVQAFLDMVAEYAQRESADVSRFLAWWEESGFKKTIATPDGQNAIRVLTVHKSKGLGFKAVLIPFGDWEIDHKPFKTQVLWCRPKQSPFNQLRLVPVRYGQALAQTIFAHDYFQERLHAFMDNLNTLYVAFTRAKEELIIFAPRPRKLSDAGQVEKIYSMADLLWAGVYSSVKDTRSGEPLVPLSDHFQLEEALFEMGADWHPIVSPVSEKQVEEISIRRLSSISPDDRLQLRLRGKGFFFDNAQRKHGTLMHEVLSQIQTSKDIPMAVEGYRWAGVIDQAEAEALIVRLEGLLRMPEVQPWFDGSAQVMNEIEILSGNGLSKRPDRVMFYTDRVVVVDYKFGERMSKQYRKQVLEYLRLIRKMGYQQVEGYLWYVELEKIEAVNG